MNTELTRKDHNAMNAQATAQDTQALRAVALASCRLIAPLWPLKTFVAVNPMLGFTDQSFEASASTLAERAGASLLMNRGYYRTMLEAGAYTPAHIDEAMKRLGRTGPMTADDVVDALNRPQPVDPAVIATAADAAGHVDGNDWGQFAVDQISFWAAGHFDDGEARQRNPWKGMPAYAAWREQATIDRTPEMMGLKGFRKMASALPDEPTTLLSHVVAELGLTEPALKPYFHRLLTSIAGWAGHVRFRGWFGELAGGEPEGMLDILAVRAAYDLLIANALHSDETVRRWEEAKASYLRPVRDAFDVPSLIAQTAMEVALQYNLVAGLSKNRGRKEWVNARPDAQLVFCIDVRSERMRRALEAANPKIETFGFAGFFGFPIEVVRFGDQHGGAQCPVLLEPAFTINEEAPSDDPAAALRTKTISKAMTHGWKRFKSAAVSSFAFVEALGLGFAGSIIRDSVGRPSPENKPLGGVTVTPCDHHAHGHDHATGMTLDQRIGTAEGALAGMSFTDNLARLVVLAGHGSTTTNNPYAAGLDCGACGGHSGEANAKVAVAVLNDPEVRTALAERGRNIPDDTVFVAGLHDTTTDEIALYNEAGIPASHQSDWDALKKDIAKAGAAVRKERAPGLGLSADDMKDADVLAKSTDWSEVRPEWGLAGCASFITAPRARTQDVDLGGRAFLHSYNWKADEDNSILELIMTAPLVVASWISLQYYGSTVDNETFGSGNKTLHNVVGGHGILEGNGGDLRSGLPFQSVHDGAAPFHQPLRLTAIIEAPIERIEKVLKDHPSVRALFDNKWLSLIAILEEGESFARYDADLTWSSITPQTMAETMKGQPHEPEPTPIAPGE